MISRLPSEHRSSCCPRGDRRLVALLTATVLGLVAGCPPQPRRGLPLEPLPMHDALGIVNENTIRIAGALKAVGSVDGQFSLPEGGKRSYHVDGFLIYLAPIYVRFDLKALGSRQFLFGCNAEAFWVFSQEDERYHCGRHGEETELATQIPIRPSQIIDALGLSPIVLEPVGGGARPVQRVTEEYQQILFLVAGESGRSTLQKEFWLDRSEPRLIRRVVFRDEEGQAVMVSNLSDHRAVRDGGPLLPHVMAAEWPATGATMRFRISRWTEVEDLDGDSVQFRTPPACFGD